MLSTPSYKDYIFFSWSCKLCYILLYFRNNNLYLMHTKFWVSVLPRRLPPPTYPAIQDTGWRFDPPMGRPSKQGLVRTCVSVTPRSIGVSAGPVAIVPQRIRSDPTAPPALFAAAGHWRTAHAHVAAATPVRTIGPCTRGKGPARAGGSKVPSTHRGSGFVPWARDEPVRVFFGKGN